MSMDAASMVVRSSRRQQTGWNGTRGGRVHCKPVIAIAPDGSWTRYVSIKDAARIVGVNPAQISTACVTGNKCAGMRWEREEMQ